jgi:hypothetical protein
MQEVLGSNLHSSTHVRRYFRTFDQSQRGVQQQSTAAADPVGLKAFRMSPRAGSIRASGLVNRACSSDGHHVGTERAGSA